MGLFSSLVKIGLTPAAAVGKVILKVVKPSSSIAQQPISTTTQQLSQTTFGKILGTATTATAAALAVASGAVTKVLPTVKSKIIAAAVAPAVISIIAEKPQALISVPKEAISFSSDVGGLIASPSLGGAAELAKEHPITTTLVAAAGALAITKSVIPAAASYFQTKAIKEQTAAIEGATTGMIGASTLELPSTPKEASLGKEAYPETSQITTISTERKRRRKAKAKTYPTIRQSVRVNVISNSSANRTTKKYINQRELIYA